MGNHGCKFWAERRMGYHEGKLDCAIGLAMPVRIHDVLQKDNPALPGKVEPDEHIRACRSHPTNMPDLEGAPASARARGHARARGGGLNKRPAGFHTEQTLHTPVGFALDNTPSFVLSKRSAGFALNKHSASFVLNKRSAGFALNERSAGFALNERSAGFCAEQTLCKFCVEQAPAGFALNKRSAGFVLNKRLQALR